jgi:hypothetical protein
MFNRVSPISMSTLRFCPENIKTKGECYDEKNPKVHEREQ